MTKHARIPELTEKQISRFWSKVDIKDSNDCWNWMGSLSRGYGHIRIQYVLYRTHRIAYFLANKRDPSGKCVCHSCDNRRCCNPSHLWLGTRIENNRDRDNKGRQYSKLTETQVRQIRKRYALGGISQRALARQYGG